jgi:sorbitol-specific phosphotransferase system component IIBC
LASDSHNLNLKEVTEETTTSLVTEENVKMVDHKAAKPNVTTTDKSAKLLDRLKATNNQKLNKNDSMQTTLKLSQRFEL